MPPQSPLSPFLLILLFFVSKKLILAHWYCGIALADAWTDPPPRPHGTREGGLSAIVTLAAAGVMVWLEWVALAMHAGPLSWWGHFTRAVVIDVTYWTLVAFGLVLGYGAARATQWPDRDGLPLTDWRSGALWLAAMAVAFWALGWLRAWGWLPTP